MREMLDAVTELKTMTAITDITLNIKVTESTNHTRFEWMDSPNSIENAWKGVSFSFDNEIFRAFGDMWDLYTIGSSSLNGSREEAVSMAMELAKNYTLRMYVNGSLMDVPFNITEDPLETHLTMQSREPLTLYPFWHVQLYFDKVYYTANGIEVCIWADTGEVYCCQATGYAGGGEEPSATPSDASSPSSSSQSSSTQPDSPPSQSPTDSSSALPEESETILTEPQTEDSQTPPPTPLYAAVAAAAILIPIA